MKTEEFRSFLNTETRKTIKGAAPLSNNAINARVSRAGRIEKELEICLDEAADNINNLKQLKQQLKENYSNNISASLYNTATRYYKFIHGEDPEKTHKEFLKL